MNENCARWNNLIEGKPNHSVTACIKKHNCPGPGCVGCPDYPKEWDDGPQVTNWEVRA